MMGDPISTAMAVFQGVNTVRGLVGGSGSKAPSTSVSDESKAASVAESQRKQKLLNAQQAGRASTRLSGSTGDDSVAGGVASKKLLGG